VEDLMKTLVVDLGNTEGYCIVNVLVVAHLLLSQTQLEVMTKHTGNQAVVFKARHSQATQSLYTRALLHRQTPFFQSVQKVRDMHLSRPISAHMSFMTFSVSSPPTSQANKGHRRGEAREAGAAHLRLAVGQNGPRFPINSSVRHRAAFEHGGVGHILRQRLATVNMGLR
jgi:hypothetical protein